MTYIGVKEKSCDMFETTLPPFDKTVVYRSIADGKLYARCRRCECDGCMIEVREQK